MLSVLFTPFTQITKMVDEDPFKALVDQQIKPAFDELASVKKQTEIYEKMDRIQGGPSNFMKTAMEAVEKLEQQLLLFQQKVFHILKHEYRNESYF